MKNFVMLALITCLSFGLNAENISDNDIAQVPIVKVAESPEAVFHEVRGEHNEMKDGQDGLHVNGRHQLKFRRSVYYNSRFIGHSRFSEFTINWTIPNPTPGNCLDIDGSSVFRQVNSTLNDLKIRLDKDITITMGDKLLYSYHVGELKISKPGYDWYFYLRAINTSDITLDAVGVEGSKIRFCM